MTTTGRSVVAGAFTVDSSVFRHLSMACVVSMPPDSMSVNIDIHRIRGVFVERIEVAVIGGGQAGLATAHALIQQGLRPVVLEASDRPAGSWPRYYDSLTLFSPAPYSSLPGLPFEGDPERYPHRDEVVAYLTRYAGRLDAEVRTGTHAATVDSNADARGKGFTVSLTGGEQLSARAVVAASGTFGHPHLPALPGMDRFEGTALHAADYRSPEQFTGRRVVVVGAGNSAVQIAVELAGVSTVSLTSRQPARFAPQRILGRDMHFWLVHFGVDAAPIGRFLRTPPTQPVFDLGRYRTAIRSGAPDWRPLFNRLDGRKVTWSDGVTEEVDAIVPATGYRPNLPYLERLSVMGDHGRPQHREGISLAHDRLAFVGLEGQRSLSSNSLRGVAATPGG
ncbi:flavin-containing monooxygenase [Streptomyces sp. DSM 116496]|uniref:flavin-containing monooxygenase n=1 Tax=Streptomyces stoeckheimensis TaxID=3344656 RepID=UPI0038B2401B